jgi:hypothetical protein
MLLLLAASSRSAASTLTGELVGHYTNVDEFIMQLQPDSTFRRVRQSASFWAQEYRLGYSTVLPYNTGMVSELRYADVSRVGLTQRTITPYGSLRLTNPVYGLSAAYRPVQQVFETLDAANDTLPPSLKRRLTSRDADLLLSAYVAAPHLPRIDGQFTQRHHFSSAQVGAGTTTQRSIRTSQEFGRATVQAGYSDQLMSTAGRRRLNGRSWTAGLDVSAAPTLRRTASFSYGFLRGDQPSSVGWNHSNNHNFNANAAYRFSDRASLNTGGFYRLSQIHSFRNSTVQDFDAFAYQNFTLRRGVVARVGGGEHSFQDGTKTRPAPYLLSSLSGEGYLRPKWRTHAAATHSTNWLGGLAPTSSEALSIGNSFEVSRSFEAHLDADASVRSGTHELGSQRYSSVVGTGVRMQPLRSFSLNLDGSLQGQGGSVLRPSSRARTGSANLSWQPWRGLSLSAARVVTGAFPNDRPRQYSSAYYGSWRISRQLQVDGNYSKSGVTMTSDNLQGGNRENFGFRITAVATRRLSANFGFQDSGHGQPNETRSVDVTASYRFNL